MLFEQEDQAYRQAVQKAMDYLSVRDHASGELYDKLCKKAELPPEAAELEELPESDPHPASADVTIRPVNSKDITFFFIVLSPYSSTLL